MTNAHVFLQMGHEPHGLTSPSTAAKLGLSPSSETRLADFSAEVSDCHSVREGNCPQTEAGAVMLKRSCAPT